MNEIELIRQQLAAEREHACAAVRACATALERAAHTPPSGAASVAELTRATIAFVAATLTSFEERDLRLAELVRARLQPEDPTRRALEEALARPGGNRELLAQLAAASAPSAPAGIGSALATWRQVAQALEAQWRARREVLEGLFAPHARVADWRRVGGIDADSILAERQRYARLQARLSDEGRPAALGGGA